MAANIKVAVAGANGRMGREVVRAVTSEKDMDIIGAYDVVGAGSDIGEISGTGALGVPVSDNLAEIFENSKAAVMVDFAVADGFEERAMTALDAGVRLVVGTTGVDAKTMKKVERKAGAKKLGVLVAPNFAIGAVLMMQFAEQAAKYVDGVEIIEMHHDGKVDAPSGTAVATAERIKDARKGMAEHRDPTKVEKLEGSRGGRLGDISVHSVRLPGFIASQEVIMGAQGQTLTIRHDTISREAFMPGVVLAVRGIIKKRSFVFGLENLL